MTFVSDYIRDLHLRPDAPYPSEVRDGHELVVQWRRTQRLRLLPCDHPDPDTDGFDPLDDGEVAHEC